MNQFIKEICQDQKVYLLTSDQGFAISYSEEFEYEDDDEYYQKFMEATSNAPLNDEDDLKRQLRLEREFAEKKEADKKEANEAEDHVKTKTDPDGTVYGWVENENKLSKDVSPSCGILLKWLNSKGRYDAMFFEKYSIKSSMPCL